MAATERRLNGPILSLYLAAAACFWWGMVALASTRPQLGASDVGDLGPRWPLPDTPSRQTPNSSTQTKRK
jgi:hypothetical protein